MKLNKKWGYGQLFGYSALDGHNRYYEDCILMSAPKKLEFRFEFRPRFIKMSFPGLKHIHIKAFMSDFLLASTSDGEFKLTFADSDTLVGLSPVLPSFKGERKLSIKKNRNVDIFSLRGHCLGLVYEKEGNLFKYVVHHSFSESEARAGANRFLESFDIDTLINDRISYYKKMPKCLDKKYESLYFKALSVNKVNVKSPEGNISRLWTTPDRVPHRHMWMWDSAFHSLAMKEYNIEAAKEILLAMLEQTDENGFMPHMANPTDKSDVTQPCVMSFATYKLYQKCQDKDFLRQAIVYLEKYLNYDLNNRDKNHNGLLEWKTESEFKECKCGESGLDNSPRFDFDEEMDCIDFSSYFALDCEYLAKIYHELGDKEKENKWMEISRTTKDKINSLLLDKDDGVYYDRLFGGSLTKVLTPTSFFPMAFGFAKEENVKKMVDVLFDNSLLNSPVPFSSISMQDSRFSNDMWRGGVWININYFLIMGLRHYGYYKQAEEVRTKTLDMMNKWYKKTGCIFEFYDPKDEVSPFYCKRKGEPLKHPDYRKHVHSISDYNWSASFAILLIQGVY